MKVNFGNIYFEAQKFFRNTKGSLNLEQTTRSCGNQQQQQQQAKMELAE